MKASSRTFEFVMPHGQVTSQDIRDELLAFARWQEEHGEIPFDEERCVAMTAVKVSLLSRVAAFATGLVSVVYFALSRYVFVPRLVPSLSQRMPC